MDLENRKQIRNLDGKLVCETFYDEDSGLWYVSIKQHGCFTILQLVPDGRLGIDSYTIRSK